MKTLMILRLIHIFGGMFWMGSTLLMVLFILPSVQATTESGQKFLEHFPQKHTMVDYSDFLRFSRC